MTILIEVVMIYQESAMKVRNNLGDILSKVQYCHDTVLVTKAGEPVAAIIDIELFTKIRNLKEDFSNLSKKISSAYIDIDSHIIDEEISEALEFIKSNKAD
jgi:prevent-host-death family protein